MSYSELCEEGKLEFNHVMAELTREGVPPQEARKEAMRAADKECEEDEESA